MRVSDNMAMRSFLSNLETIRERFFQRNVQVSSGKKLRVPSQDPQGSGRVLRIRDQMLRVGQFTRNIQQARVEMRAGEDVLSALRNEIDTVIVKTQQGLNDVISQGNRDLIAAEIDDILQGMVQLSSTTLDGKRLFSGSTVFTNPVILSGGSYVYQGNTKVRSVEIAENRQVQVNVVGSDVFTETSSDLLNSVQQIAVALRASDTAAATTLMGKMNKAIDALDRARMGLGVTLSQLDSTETELNKRVISLTGELSELEDADMAEAISGLTQSEIALRAALGAGATIRQPNLLDFLA